MDRLAEARNWRIGFAFKSFNLFPQLSAFENVEMPLLLAGRSTRRSPSEAALAGRSNETG